MLFSSLNARLALAGLLCAPAAAQLGPAPEPPQNPVTESKRLLGKALFWDEQLSSDNSIACGTWPVYLGTTPPTVSRKSGGSATGVPTTSA